MSALINLLAPAKINLSLDVLGQRRDGYHIVEMVMQTIDLCDYISLEVRADEQIQVHCAHSYVPGGQENLTYKAADLMRKLAGKSNLGVTIKIVKNIPVAAGLGGGSADAAAVLKGLNKLWGLNFSDVQLAQAGLQLGADVPFCLMGGTVLARGIGEELTRLPAPTKLWVVLLKPNVGVSTADVYKNYNACAVQKRPDTHRLIAALSSGPLEAVPISMANVLESVTFTRLPVLRHLKQKAMEFGALAALMSGSGPTIFALASEYRRAEAIYIGLRRQVEFAYITTFKEVPMN